MGFVSILDISFHFELLFLEENANYKYKFKVDNIRIFEIQVLQYQKSVAW